MLPDYRLEHVALVGFVYKKHKWIKYEKKRKEKKRSPKKKYNMIVERNTIMIKNLHGIFLLFSYNIL